MPERLRKKWIAYRIISDQRCAATLSEIMALWNINDVIEVNETLDFLDSFGKES